MDTTLSQHYLCRMEHLVKVRETSWPILNETGHNLWRRSVKATLEDFALVPELTSQEGNKMIGLLMDMPVEWREEMNIRFYPGVLNVDDPLRYHADPKDDSRLQEIE